MAHYQDEDTPFNNCPKSLKGTENPEAGTACTCPADEHNAKVFACIRELEDLYALPYRVGTILARKLSRQLAEVAEIFPNGCALKTDGGYLPLVGYGELSVNWEVVTIGYAVAQASKCPYKVGMELINKQTGSKAKIASIVGACELITLELSPRVFCSFTRQQVENGWDLKIPPKYAVGVIMVHDKKKTRVRITAIAAKVTLALVRSPNVTADCDLSELESDWSIETEPSNES